MKSAPYINRSAVKKLALAICRNTGRPFTRVSSEFLDGLSASLAETVAIRVHKAPSRGKTL